MHRSFRQANEASAAVIAAAIEVHREMGPGLIESIYERCLAHELALKGLAVETQKQVTVRYKGTAFDAPLRLDLLVEGCLVVECKVVETVLPVHKAQLLSYLKLVDAPVGLLLNFNEVLLKEGIHRLILKGADA